ncbi:alpha/beta hydrolase domain-containing protein [Pararobbsia silviterrae]|uniref:Peptidase n=1 Tax=Pararobbsia silviterrae TaxID=1792498 RepID=A0A494X146_9BURK|nr:alpha/beta hydrolase domain-containing protein [Pararobbsia silviterrae]RKP44447.1 peptidase [Pararobbsia silviterrae]
MKKPVAGAVLLTSVLAACSSVGDHASTAMREGGRVRTFEVHSDGPAFGGAVPTGASGPYRVITATVHGELDPAAPANAGIAGLAQAPRDADGYVEYATDVVILTPQNPANGKRVLFYDVVNRGLRLGQTTFVGGGALDTGAAPNGSIPSLLEDGYTVVWSGWQGTIPMTGNATLASTGAVGVSFPVARNADGTSIVGQSREEFIPDYAGGVPTSIPLTYPPAKPSDVSTPTLTARQSWATQTAQGRAGDATYDAPSVPVSNWHYTRAANGGYAVDFTPPASVPGPRGTNVAPDAGTIYSFVYEAADPTVNGIGFAAVRDLVAFLRYRPSDATGHANPLNGLKQAACVTATCTPEATNIDVAIGEGISQSGRFLRDFLYQGFNTDVDGHVVFDAMLPIVPGARRTWINSMFSQPGRWSKEHEDHFMPGFQFPFAYNVMTDPVTGKTDGLLARCSANASCPKIMQIDGAFEWWGAAASLVTTDGAGHDLTLPPNVRYYLVPGTQHTGGPGVTTGLYDIPAPGSLCALPRSTVAEEPVDRALVRALERWVAQDETPPPSRYPTIASGEAVAPNATGFPDLTRVVVPNGPNAAPTSLSVPSRDIHNPLFVTDYSTAIPRVNTSKPYAIFESRVDRDGNETSGVRVPDLVAPIATYTGWSPRGAGHAEGESCSMFGSVIAFAPSDGARAPGDPRASLADRYTGRADYVAKVTAAANALAAQGYLLPVDAAAYASRARQVSPLLIPNP